MRTSAEAPGELRGPTPRSVPTVAVAGNPNAGKSTIFNRLTGLSQKVANYPGVTVEKKEGRLAVGSRTVRIIDLPGTYSLAAYSPDEMVAADVILGLQPGEPRPDLIVHVVDASNLERNLYLYSQLRELGVPVLIALNMMDVAHRHGVEIDVEALATALDTTVVVTHGQRGQGAAELRTAIDAALAGAVSPRTGPTPIEDPALPDPLRAAVAELSTSWNEAARRRLRRDLHPFEILRALVDRRGFCAQRLAEGLGEEFREDLHARRQATDSGGQLAAIEARSRYDWVRRRLEGVVRHTQEDRRRASERLDDWLTHPVLGLVVFAAVMLVLFQSIFSWAAPLMDLIDGFFGWLGSETAQLLPEGAFRSLLVDGVIGGVGGVVIFLPQILILFLFIGLLEDCGYMARAAFLMDRLMSKCGLSGKSFIPMLSGFACAVPGIMAARVIEDRRDRLATILVTPLMSCSARLPVYTIFTATFIPDEPLLGRFLGLRAATLLALYALGVVTAIAMAWIFKKTILRGASPPFVLELPSYKLPALQSVGLRLLGRAKAFLTRAGTIILAISVVVWALAYFPRSEEVAERFAADRATVAAELAALPENDPRAEELRTRLDDLDRAEAGAQVRESLFGRMGHAVEPVFRPLGWDWRISMAAIASFPAREVIVATLGTIFNLGDDIDEESDTLRSRLRESTWDDSDQPLFTIPVALSIMVFFALCCQCGATIATIKRETGSWGWAWLTFGYMTVLAYVGALAVYEIATLCGL